MGRRALKKPGPSIDTSGQLLTIDGLPKPWDPRALFGRRAPLEIEIGSGKGLFIRTSAAARPQVDFLGIEISTKYAHFAAAALVQRGLKNGVMMAGDGPRVFDEFLPDDSIAAIHLYFPDPWWKRRHRKRRVLREPFLRNVQRTLVPGGRLHFWTDVKEYYDTSLTLLGEVTNLQGPIEVWETPAEHNMDYRTHFERRTRLHGEAVYRAEFCKQQEPILRG